MGTKHISNHHPHWLGHDSRERDVYDFFRKNTQGHDEKVFDIWINELLGTRGTYCWGGALLQCVYGVAS